MILIYLINIYQKNSNYPTNFYYKGKFYSNLNQFAKAWGIDFRAIYSRWNRGICGYYHVSLASNDKIRYRITAEEIEDLIAYPTIYAKDLVTRKVILDSIPDCFNKSYSGKTFHIKLVKKMFEQKKHKRFDTSLLQIEHSRSATVYGVTKADARAIIRTATRKAQKQAEESKKQREIKFKTLIAKQKRQREQQKQSREAAKWVKAQKFNSTSCN